jgi:hypothetical protein
MATGNQNVRRGKKGLAKQIILYNKSMIIVFMVLACVTSWTHNNAQGLQSPASRTGLSSPLDLNLPHHESTSLRHLEPPYQTLYLRKYFLLVSVRF